MYDVKYLKTDLHKVMENKCQYLTTIQRNEFLKLLKKFEYFLMEHLAPGKHIQ